MADSPVRLDARPDGAGPLLSFEFFPPKTDAGDTALWRAVEALSDTRPDFVSVTYGAAGTTRETSLRTVRRISSDTSLTPVAHLTCVAASRETVAHLVDDFLDAGIRSFLALRGDPPRRPTAQPVAPASLTEAEARPRGELKYAAQLIDLLLAEAASRRLDREAVAIGVAAFPGGHPQSSSLDKDVAVLAHKQRAGATFAITQLFFHAHEYGSLVARARAAGVTIPIIPGIMPMLSADRLRSIVALSGEQAPPALLNGLDAREGDEAREFGMAATEALAREVLALGAPGLHIYTLNQADPAIDLVTRLGLRAAPALR